MFIIFLSHCALKMTYDNTGQHWLRQWLVDWWHQAITWINVEFSLMSFCGILLREISQQGHKLLCIMDLKIILLELLPCFSGANELYYWSIHRGGIWMLTLLEGNMSYFVISCLPTDISKTRFINTWRPRQNGRHIPDDHFKRIFLNENVWISIKFSLKFVPGGPINDFPALVQIMAWRRPGDKPLSELMMVSLLTHICVTRPQWVNSFSSSCFCDCWIWQRTYH